MYEVVVCNYWPGCGWLLLVVVLVRLLAHLLEQLLEWLLVLLLVQLRGQMVVPGGLATSR